MKISCDVIRDLLPLYFDGVVSRDTGALIAAHIKECPVCKRYFRSMQAKELVAGEFGKGGDYTFIAKRLRTKRITTQTAVGLIILALLGYAVYKNIADERTDESRRSQ